MSNNGYLNGFTSTYNKAIIELKAHLYRTYSYIVSRDYKGEGMFYSQERISKDLNLSIRTIQRHISKLKELGYISVKRRGFNMTNLYTVNGVLKKVKEAKEELTTNFKKKFTNTPAKPKKKLKFDNFQGREYTKEQWDKLENQLLGWE